MGDSRRFHLMALEIEKFAPDRNIKIADVAAGKGYLQAALRQLGYKNVTSYDKRKKNAKGRSNYKYKWFTWNIKEEYDLVIGMHPDEATDNIIKYAAIRKVKAVVCPCCIKPNATILNEHYNYSNWIKHLISINKDGFYEIKKLKMSGKNDLLFFK